MFDLPKKETELIVEVEEGRVRLFMAPLDDEEYFRINETAELQEEEGVQRLVFRASRIPGLFERKLRRIEGVQVDGAPFDPAIPEHMARVRQPWKGVAIAHLIRYAMGLTETERGNSTAPGASSSTEETHSQG